MKLGPEPGWRGWFTREQALGAWRNGTRIVKVAVEEGDAHPVGSLGTVLGSMAAPPEMIAQLTTEFGRRSRVLYFVEWDDLPRHAVGVVSAKIGPAP